MALKNTLDPATVAERLAAWLPDVVGADGPVAVTDVVIPSASGMSSETILFDASWGSGTTAVSRGYVVRVPPAGGGIFGSYYDLGREVAVMRVLADATDAPVPNVVAHETSGDVLGAEFLLVDRVYGQVPGDDPPFTTAGFVVDLPDEARAAMWDNALRAIAGIQAIDPLEHDLGFLRHDDLGDTVVDQEFAYWRGFYEWAAGDRRSPTIDEALDVLWSRRPTEDGPLVVSWGDGRFGNLMFGPDHEVTGVLDWEMATLGRPEVDLGYWLFFDKVYSQGLGIPRLTGFPERAETIARFEELSGRTVRDLDWFEAWAALRGAILIVRVGNLMIEHGFLPADHAMPWNNPAAQVLATLLDLPAPSGEAGWITGNRD